MARRKNRYCDTVLYGVCLVFCAVCFSTSHAESLKIDLRIVTPISQTLKDFDAKQQRADILKSWVELVADGNKMGVWTYGKYVNMLVPHREINQVWKQQAIDKLDHIAAAASQHNLVQALEKATYKSASNDTNQVHVVIFTDGGISLDNPEREKTAYDRVVNTLLPSWIDRGVVIHSLALGGSADTELLSMLSERTGGSYYHVDDSNYFAEAAFLIANTYFFDRPFFEVSTQAFVVNQALSSMQIIYLRQSEQTPHEKRVLVRSPKGVTYPKQPMSDTVFHSEYFSLFKQDNPVPGNWVAEAQSKGARYFIQLSREPLSSGLFSLKSLPKKRNITVRATKESHSVSSELEKQRSEQNVHNVAVVRQVDNSNMSVSSLQNRQKNAEVMQVNEPVLSDKPVEVPSYHAELKQILPPIHDSEPKDALASKDDEKRSLTYKLFRLIEIFHELPTYVKIWLYLLAISCAVLVLLLLAWPFIHRARKQQSHYAVSA